MISSDIEQNGNNLVSVRFRTLYIDCAVIIQTKSAFLFPHLTFETGFIYF